MPPRHSRPNAARQPGVTLLRLGHFAGGAMLHRRAAQSGRGALLSGDIIQVVQNRESVSFMRSYPNLIPLPAPEVERMVKALEPCESERVYGAWYGRVVARNGKRPRLGAALHRGAGEGRGLLASVDGHF